MLCGNFIKINSTLFKFLFLVFLLFLTFPYNGYAQASMRIRMEDTPGSAPVISRQATALSPSDGSSSYNFTHNGQDIQIQSSENLFRVAGQDNIVFKSVTDIVRTSRGSRNETSLVPYKYIENGEAYNIRKISNDAAFDSDTTVWYGIESQNDSYEGFNILSADSSGNFVKSTTHTQVKEGDNNSLIATRFDILSEDGEIIDSRVNDLADFEGVGPQTTFGVVTNNLATGATRLYHITKERVSMFVECKTDILCYAKNTAYFLIMTPAALILGLSGEFFDFILNYSVFNMNNSIFSSGGVGGDSAVDYGWKIFRDLTNILLIFVLLYISIKTILSGVGSVKKQIATVIMVAIMINFSMFFAKVFIDVTNIVATNFYNQINSLVLEPDGTTMFPNPFDRRPGKASVAGVFMSTTNIASIYNNTKSTAGDAVFLIQQAFAGSLLMIVLAIVLIIQSFMLLTRLIVLIFVLMISSLAIGSLVLPQLKTSIFNKWFSALIGQAMVAPVLLFMLYLSILFIRRVPGNEKGMQDVLTSNIEDLLPYFMTIGFLIFSIIISKKLGDRAGSISGKLTSGIGGVALGGAAWASRRTIGVGARAWANNIEGNTVASRFLKTGLTKTAGSSLDFRNTKSFKKVSGIAGVDVGKAGGKGGYDAIAKKADKKREANYKMVGEQTTKEKKTLDRYNQAVVTNAGLEQYLAIRGANERIDEVRNSERMADLGQKEHEGTITESERSELAMMNKIISEQQKIVDKSQSSIKAEDLEKLEKIGEAELETFKQMREDAKNAKKAGEKRQSNYMEHSDRLGNISIKIPRTENRISILPSHQRFAQSQRAKKIKEGSKTDLDKIVEGVTKGTKDSSDSDKKESGDKKEE